MDSRSLMPKILKTFLLGDPNRNAKCRWRRLKSAVFNQYHTISQKQCKTETVTMEG